MMVSEHAAEPGTTPLLVVVPRDQAAAYGCLVRAFADLQGCRIIIERRLAERRKVEGAGAAAERRQGERRSGDLDHGPGLVVLIR